jgi:Family of unknown function (DUF6334)
MKVDAALAVGEALFPVLSGFHEIGQQSLRAVWQTSTAACLDQIISDFDRLSLIVSAKQEDDSIDFDVVVAASVDRTGGVDASQLPEWKDLIDVPFGWGWVTVNQQGYCDGLLLSFGGIVPQVVLNVTASSILVGRIGAMWTA